MAIDFPTNRGECNPVIGVPGNTDALQNGDTTLESNILYTFVVSGANSWWSGAQGVNLDNRYVEVGGDTMTGNLTVPSLNGGPLSGFRNQIINGEFRFWQRGNGPWTNPSNKGVYTADRWIKFAQNNANEHQKAGSVGPFPNSMLCTAASGALGQLIELPSAGEAGPFQPNTVWTLSVYSDNDLTSHTPVAQFRSQTGTSQTAITSAQFVATGESYGAYNRYSSTVSVQAVTPEATEIALFININAHAAGELNTSVTYTGIQLEPGPVATPFELRPYSTEFDLCSRYFRSCGNLLAGKTNSGAQAQLFPSNRQERSLSAIVDINPTASLSFAGLFRENGATPDDISTTYTTINAGVSTGRRIRIAGLGTELIANGARYAVANGRFFFDCEL